MAIKIIEDQQPDVMVTREELRRYRQEYQRDFSSYAGPLPSLEEYIRRRRRDAETRVA